MFHQDTIFWDYTKFRVYIFLPPWILLSPISSFSHCLLPDLSVSQTPPTPPHSTQTSSCPSLPTKLPHHPPPPLLWLLNASSSVSASVEFAVNKFPEVSLSAANQTQCFRLPMQCKLCFCCHNKDRDGKEGRGTKKKKTRKTNEGCNITIHTPG